MVKEKLVITTCATSLGTSLHYAQEVRDIAKEVKIPVKTQPMASSGTQIEDFVKRMGKPDFVIGDPVFGIKRKVPADVPVLSGIPFLTGIGKDKLIGEIKKLLLKN